MNKIFYVFYILCFCNFVSAQKVDFVKESLPVVEKIGVVDFSKIDDPYFASVVNLEAPSVSGNSYKKRLSEIKKEIALLYPPIQNEVLSKRSFVNPPEVLASFSGSMADDAGIPLDNHLAVSGGQVISAYNSQIVVKSEDGLDLAGFSLAQLSSQVNLTEDVFDPRLLYDTEADRFIAVFLHGRESNLTNIVIAFSATNDATGVWNVYELTGNPNMNNTWTDYPMINVTQTDLIITGNLIFDNQPWQTGFDETVLWQVNKANGYNGEALQSELYKSITFDGFNIRNLCPVESGDEILESNCLFLSNRNFSMENDTIFIVELTGGINDPNTTIEIDVAKSNVPYGVPPNAEMFFGQLQTNDARVLEAFYMDDEIQFVGNTRNLTNNLAGIYHGRIFNVSGTRDVTLEHIIGPDFEIGYPGITYTGVEPGEMDAILTFGHTARTLNTGISTLYFDPVEGYSDMETIKEGDGYIALISGPVERWGDYAGSQRDHANPGNCWISGFYATDTRNNAPWVCNLARPQIETSNTEALVEKLNANVFPNPVSERFSLEFEMPVGLSKIDVNLYDQTGRLVDRLMSSRSVKPGMNRLSFDINQIPSGLYQVSIITEGQSIVNKSLVVE